MTTQPYKDTVESLRSCFAVQQQPVQQGCGVLKFIDKFTSQIARKFI